MQKTKYLAVHKLLC